MIKTDIIIIGAGPVGLFTIFEAGLMKLHCHVIDAIPQIGGQLKEIYPKKPIYDIPGFPSILAGDLIDNLEKQAEPFQPGFTLGERAESIDKQEDGTFIVTTNEGTQHQAPAVIIAGGLGSFEPRKPMTNHFTMAVRSTFLLLAMCSLLPADVKQLGKPVDFARDILPILSNKCFVCHGPDGKAKEQLRLDSFAAATLEIDGHRAINPADPAKSGILVRIHSKDEPMPPADAEKQLTASERELLTRWVKQGGTYAKHWAFVPPRKVSAPDKGNQSEIDAWTAARLREKELDFAPAADLATLARRASLVLTGLPPEPDQLAAFLADKRPDAYARFVDRLLASPRFGEHQARYWLDAVRYGDTHGLHLDNRRGIYPYRDWVVMALNSNLPLNEFITGNWPVTCCRIRRSRNESPPASCG